MKPSTQPALRIAILGAESTGKTALAAALAPALAQHTGLRVTWVPELLREWCDNVGRTPLAHEQAAILRGQQERIDAAAAAHEIVVCDTTPLMTAVYSRMVFSDLSLEARAVALHRGVALSLLTALDLPWVADGLQRDGPQVREPVDGLLRGLLLQHRLPWALVSGTGAARLQSAIDALAPLLRQRLPDQARPDGAPLRGLFSRLHDSPAEDPRPTWFCESCDDPACERRSRRHASNAS